MKKILAYLLFCGQMTEISAQPRVLFTNSDVTVSQLTANKWIFETADKTAMYLIEGNQAAALIDTGTEVRALDSIVRLITSKPLQVIITHWHPDHAGGADYFPDVWMHPADTVLLHRKSYDGNINYLREGDVIDLGGVRLHIALMPGHTPGSIVLSDYESGDCYTGDAFGSGQVWLQCVPMQPLSTYLASCRKMLDIMDEHGIRRLYCGHYPYVKRPYDRHYVEGMAELATRLLSRNQPSRPFNNSRYATTTRIAADSLSHTMIVFDPALVR